MSLYRRPSTAGISTTGDLGHDVTIGTGPEDGISALSWSTQADHLAVASWDGKVRIYDITSNPTGNGVAMINFDGPVLSVDWTKNGSKVVGSGTDKSARLLDLGGDGAPVQQVAVHDEAIRSVHFFSPSSAAAEMVVTGSWDRSLRYWDLRQATPVASVPLSGKVYSMDVRDNLLVAATSDLKIHVVDLANPTTVFKTIESPLKMQTRVVACFNESNGFGVGSVEGRCAMSYVNGKDVGLNYTFRCHRDQKASNKDVDVHTVNCLGFHPVFNTTFSTAGSDGTFHFWDRDAHLRLKTFPAVGGPISAAAFNRDGKIFAYGVSYDWSKGFAHNSAQQSTKIMLHPVEESEVKPRAEKKK